MYLHKKLSRNELTQPVRGTIFPLYNINLDHSFGCFCISGQVLYFTYTTCSPLTLPGSEGILTEVGSAFD